MLASSNDSMSVAFWYKNDEPNPLFAIDARHLHAPTSQQSFLAAAKRYNNNNNLLSTAEDATQGKRTTKVSADKTSDASKLELDFEPLQQSTNPATSGAKIEIDSQQSAAFATQSAAALSTASAALLQLTVNNASVAQNDTAKYKCRVDFKRARTITQSVQLFVFEPLQGVRLSVRLADQKLSLDATLNSSALARQLQARVAVVEGESARFECATSPSNGELSGARHLPNANKCAY